MYDTKHNNRQSVRLAAGCRKKQRPVNPGQSPQYSNDMMSEGSCSKEGPISSWGISFQFSTAVYELHEALAFVQVEESHAEEK